MFPLLQVRVVDLLTPSIFSPDTLITMKREHKELLSSWHNQRWLKPPSRTKHSGGVFVCYFGWTGRCCLYPLVSRCSCCWLGTVSLTINQSFLQLKTPRKQGGFLGFLSHSTSLYCTVLRDGLTTEGGYQIHRISPPLV